jgi:predicted solute-binding protein
LNTVPLVWGMLHGGERERFELEFRIPADCAARLAGGQADIGLVPAIEIERQGLEIVPGVGIACEGPVRSILLVSKVAPAAIRTVALDASSRTSAVLARIVLARRYGVEPEVTVRPPVLETMLAEADAALLIGDPALRVESPLPMLDLGQEWLELTGLPFVFAMWAGRPGAARHAPVFQASCRFGLEHLEEIAGSEAPRRGIPVERARDYLERRIRFGIGEREIEGMRLFWEYARAFATVGTSA